MTDVTADVGLADTRGFRIFVADLNGDFYPDLILHDGRIMQNNQIRVFMNVLKPGAWTHHDRTFVDFTEESNINVGRVAGLDGRQTELLTFADLDNDGDLDAASGMWYWDSNEYDDVGHRHEILLNDGTGRFTLVEESGLPGIGLVPATQMAWLDFDMDGVLDLYVATFSPNHALGIFHNDLLLRGDGTGKFTDISFPAGLGDESWPNYGGNVTDWNNDGWPDLISSPYCRNSGNLWRNNGDGTFTEASAEANYSAQHMQGDNGQTMCQWEALPADFDNDGDMDLAQILVHGGLGNIEGRTTLAVNGGAETGYRYEWERERLRRKMPASTHLGDQDAVWFDLENDGLLDLVVSQSVYIQQTDRMYIFNQNEDHTFDDITGALGLITEIQSTHAMEPIDFDLDGDDDLLIAKWRRGTWEPENRDRVVMLRNDVAHKNNWIAVGLQPKNEGTNRSAIGARIAVHTGDRTQIRDIQAGRGHFGGQQPFIRNFGLGSATAVDSIVVRWPHAGFPTTTVIDPPINEIAIITEDGYDRTITSVNGEEFATDEAVLNIYPNPAAGSCRIGIPASLKGERLELRVTDMLGRTLLTLRPAHAAREFVLNTAQLPAGMYHVQLVSGGGATAAGRLVVRGE